MGRGENEGGWRVQVDRYTRGENDAVAAAITSALEESDEIAFEHTVDSELEDGGVLIRAHLRLRGVVGGEV